MLGIRQEVTLRVGPRIIAKSNVQVQAKSNTLTRNFHLTVMFYVIHHMPLRAHVRDAMSQGMALFQLFQSPQQLKENKYCVFVRSLNFASGHTTILA